MKDTEQRILHSATQLFSCQGVQGTSVRQICAEAKTSANMVHHFFHSKQGLLEAVLKQFSTQVLQGPARILQEPPQSPEDFRIRLRLCYQATLDALIEHKEAVEVAMQEIKYLAPARFWFDTLLSFLNTAQEAGWISAQMDLQLTSGFMMDRLVNQVRFADTIKNFFGQDIAEPAYKESWLNANFDLMFYGLAGR